MRWARPVDVVVPLHFQGVAVSVDGGLAGTTHPGVEAHPVAADLAEKATAHALMT